jgi:methionyl-tRNA formyltransferase
MAARMRVVFMGSAPIALPTLRYLQAHHELLAVVTQPDKPTGRKRLLTPTAVKAEALHLGVPVHEPTRLKDPAFLDLLAAYRPEVIVVLAYGRLVPPAVLDLPPHGCINIHGSILPAYRGACPIERAILDGLTTTGLTTFYMAQGFDTGDMIFTLPMEIAAGETAGQLRERMGEQAVGLIDRTLGALVDGTAPRIPQEHSLATHAAVITRQEACIDWRYDAQRIECLVRACEPEPGAYTGLRGQSLKVRKVALGAPCDPAIPPGTVVAVERTGPRVAAGRGQTVVLTEVQPAGKSWLTGAQLVAGYRLAADDRLDSAPTTPAS